MDSEESAGVEVALSFPGRSGISMRYQTWLVVFSFVLSTLWSTAVALGADILPAGTNIAVRTTQPVAAGTAYVGSQLNAIVDDNVIVHGRVVVPSASLATVEVANVERSSNTSGRNRLSFRLIAIHVGDRTYRASSNSVDFTGRSEGNRSRRSVLGGAGVGAAVGGIVGGGTGAAVGAAAGGTTGAIAAGSTRSSLAVPAETRLRFQLTSSLQIGQ